MERLIHEGQRVVEPSANLRPIMLRASVLKLSALTSQLLIKFSALASQRLAVLPVLSFESLSRVRPHLPPRGDSGYQSTEGNAAKCCRHISHSR
ncbi:MAG: hypothetical protein ACRDLN_01865 [Solirubrobacteraceae bacterium]